MKRNRRRTTSDQRVEKSGQGVPNNEGGAHEPDPPRAAGPSPAWERLRRQRDPVVQPGMMFAGRNDVLLTCRCWEPWVGGHAYNCPLFMELCSRERTVVGGVCGGKNGLHFWDCHWWDENKTRTPFDGKRKRT